MERYQVILAYDGSHFKGYQRQANDRTVQGVVESALRRLQWQGTSILAAGRTDTGAHATGQVISFDLTWDHGTAALRQALNKYLPADVAAREVRQVPATFHPRYDAAWRKYLYHIYCQPVRQPLLEPYAWRVWPEVDPGILHGIAAKLIGTHDFGAFGTPSHSGGNTTRCVLESSWRVADHWLEYEIKAHAFLYHMVRRLVFIQVRIAQGKMNLTALEHSLESGSGISIDAAVKNVPGKRLVHGLAPARGLVLQEVHYPEGVLSSGVDTK